MSESGVRFDGSPLRVLFLCTRNAARSQIAEALLQKKGRGQFEAGSAGSDPAPEVNPLAVQTLRQHGIDWSHASTKGLEAVQEQPWDLVITVCDQARENCLSLPSRPIFAHWGIPDPEAEDDPGGQKQAVDEAFRYLSRRIDLMLALPFEGLARTAAEERLRAIGADGQDTDEAI